MQTASSVIQTSVRKHTLTHIHTHIYINVQLHNTYSTADAELSLEDVTLRSGVEWESLK